MGEKKKKSKQNKRHDHRVKRLRKKGEEGWREVSDRIEESLREDRWEVEGAWREVIEGGSRRLEGGWSEVGDEGRLEGAKR